jgi:patatin-like phospholipase/acyl hydrolase
VIGGMVLIDGGVIANDPTLYAYMHATYNLKHSKIRVLSIGTGMAATTQLDPDTTTSITWLEEIGTLLTTTEQFAQGYAVGFLADEYYRF